MIRTENLCKYFGNSLVLDNMGRVCYGAIRAGRDERQGTELSGATVRRAETARRYSPVPGYAPVDHAF